MLMQTIKTDHIMNKNTSTYESPKCEICMLFNEVCIMTGSSTPGGLGELEDNVYGEDFI